MKYLERAADQMLRDRLEGNTAQLPEVVNSLEYENLTG